MALRADEQRDNSTDLCASGREYHGAIDCLSAPTFYSPSPSKVASALPSVAAQENPTSAAWPPQDSG
ncbi:MAG TPA: hypothetical protein VIG91_04125 [Terriglobales bacterium]